VKLIVLKHVQGADAAEHVELKSWIVPQEAGDLGPGLSRDDNVGMGGLELRGDNLLAETLPHKFRDLLE